MISVLLVAVSEEQLRSNLRADLPLVILGSIIADDLGVVFSQ